MYQRSAQGQPLPEAIGAAGLMTGVRADTGRHPLPGTRSETVTEGLDGLAGRLEGWARRGAQFAVWRAMLAIGPGSPSPVAVRANAQALGRYAVACQAAGLVPVVAPQVGGAGPHSASQGETVLSLLLLAVLSELDAYGVDPATVVLMPTMALPGRESGVRASTAESAETTLRSLGGVPVTLAGVAFAAGAQRPERATANPGGDAVIAALLAADVRLRPGPDRAGAGRLGRPAWLVGGGPGGPGPPGGDEPGGHGRPLRPGTGS